MKIYFYYFLSAKKYFLVLLFSVFCFSFSFAEEIIFPENNTHDRVIDNANIFSSDEEKKILNQIKKIEDETTAQIAILTVSTLQNLEIFDYGIQLLKQENWKIGQADKDNGLLLIVAPKERKYQFFTGYGLEGILPDLRLKIIAENYFPENFRAEHYYQGVQLALGDIEKFLLNDEEIISQYKILENEYNGWNSLAIIFLFIIAFLGGSFVSSFSGKKKSISQFIGSLAIGSTIATPFIFFLGGAGAIALFLLFSRKYSSDEKELMGDAVEFLLHSGGGWSSGSGFSSGGGFSDFGGGSFGGGGSGGSW